MVLLVLNRPVIPSFFKDLFYGILLTFLFYYVFQFSHGRGWGFRYAHGILPNIILVSLLGFYSFASLEIQQLKKIALLTLAWTFFITYPLKAAEIRFELQPFEKANEAISHLPYEYVILSPHDAWYANDLIRNEPSLTRRPLRLNANFLTPEEIQELVQSGKAIRLCSEFYQKHGIPLLKP